MGMNEVYRQTLEYQDGRAAYQEGERRGHNPYASGERKGNATAWWMGWDDEKAAYDARYGDDNTYTQEFDDFSDADPGL